MVQEKNDSGFSSSYCQIWKYSKPEYFNFSDRTSNVKREWTWLEMSTRDGAGLSSGGSRISPRRGRQLPGGGRQHMILTNFLKNYIKLKEFVPGGARPSRPPQIRHCYQWAIAARYGLGNQVSYSCFTINLDLWLETELFYFPLINWSVRLIVFIRILGF